MYLKEDKGFFKSLLQNVLVSKHLFPKAAMLATYNLSKLAKKCNSRGKFLELILIKIDAAPHYTLTSFDLDLYTR